MAEPAKQLSPEELEKLSEVPGRSQKSGTIIDFNQARRELRQKKQQSRAEAAQPSEEKKAAEIGAGAGMPEVTQGVAGASVPSSDQDKQEAAPGKTAGATEKAGQAAQAAGAGMQTAGKGTNMAGKAGEKAGGVAGAGLGGAAGAATGAVAGALGGPGGIAAGAKSGMAKGANIGKNIGELPGKAAQKAGKGMEKAGDETKKFGRRFRRTKKNRTVKKEGEEKREEKSKKLDVIGKILFFGLLCFSLLIDVLPLVTGGFSSVLDWLLDFTFWFAISLVLFLVTSDIIGSLVGKRGALNMIQTILEFIPAIDALPIHTFALAIIYLDLQFGILKIKRMKGAFTKIKKKLTKPVGR